MLGVCWPRPEVDGSRPFVVLDDGGRSRVVARPRAALKLVAAKSSHQPGQVVRHALKSLENNPPPKTHPFSQARPLRTPLHAQLTAPPDLRIHIQETLPHRKLPPGSEFVDVKGDGAVALGDAPGFRSNLQVRNEELHAVLAAAAPLAHVVVVDLAARRAPGA